MINIIDNFKFIDTHSTYRDGSEYGDKSYLIWNGGEFIIRKSDEINESQK